jgi:hypothetical protein
MPIELVPDLGNVVRFPVEQRARPTLDLLRAIAPDVREVLQVAESFAIDLPGPELRHDADERTAGHILNHVRPEPGPERRAMLQALLAPLVARAVEACRRAHDASVAATRATQLLITAQGEGGYWLLPLEEQATALCNEAAQLLVVAHVEAEAAEGAARAIGMAMRGEPWAPFSLRVEAEALFFSGGPAHRAG